MSRSRYIKKAKPKRRPDKPVSVEELAGLFRATGWSTVHRDMVEERLGRRLNRHERRAFGMAVDSTSNPNGAKRAHTKRQQGIRAGLTTKNARLPRPVSDDPQPARPQTSKPFAQTSRVAPVPDRPADYREAYSVLRPSRANPALLERVTEHVRQRPAQEEQTRRAIRQQYPQRKPEDWDRKR